MTFAVTIALAGPPRGKGRPRATTRGGVARMYTDEKTVRYEAQLRYAAMEQMAGRSPTADPVLLGMTIAFAVPTSWSKKKTAAALAGQIWPCVKPDADNTLKLTDALNGVVWVDDKQVVLASVRKIYSERPGLMIQVESVEGRLAGALAATSNDLLDDMDAGLGR